MAEKQQQQTSVTTQVRHPERSEGSQVVTDKFICSLQNRLKRQSPRFIPEMNRRSWHKAFIFLRQLNRYYFFLGLLAGFEEVSLTVVRGCLSAYSLVTNLPVSASLYCLLITISIP